MLNLTDWVTLNEPGLYSIRHRPIFTVTKEYRQVAMWDITALVG